MINSGEFTGMKSSESRKKIVEKAGKEGFGGEFESFRLRDWLISRQRYWGAPIPLIHCKACGVVPVPDSDLPVRLPEGLKLSKKGSPLTQVTEWVNTKCPK